MQQTKCVNHIQFGKKCGLNVFYVFSHIVSSTYKNEERQHFVHGIPFLKVHVLLLVCYLFLLESRNRVLTHVIKPFLLSSRQPWYTKLILIEKDKQKYHYVRLVIFQWKIKLLVSNLGLIMRNFHRSITMFSLVAAFQSLLKVALTPNEERLVTSEMY